MALQARLPASHLDSASRDVIKLGMGLVATMAALVLGLLVGDAKNNFDREQVGFEQLATNATLLDRSLAHYGPETQAARAQLRASLRATVTLLWPNDGGAGNRLDDEKLTRENGAVFAAVGQLTPKTDIQRGIQQHCLQIMAEMGRTRWTLNELQGETIPIPFLVVLAFWLFALFLSFGLFAPRNGTVITVLVVSALSVAGAVFLVIDMDEPFDGLIQVSNAPLKNALRRMESTSEGAGAKQSIPSSTEGKS